LGLNGDPGLLFHLRVQVKADDRNEENNEHALRHKL